MTALRAGSPRLLFSQLISSSSPRCIYSLSSRKAKRTMTSHSFSPPRIFPTSGFVTIDPKVKVEEEELPTYVPEHYYPVAIGEVFNSRYQVVSKLGFGISSTVWLCRDLLLVNPVHVPGSILIS
jgi:hypothetical protein